ncbi:MAG: OmpA family protein [Flavobacteriaceae bacterium]
MKFLRLVLVLSIFASGSILAQNSAYPWQISVGLTMPSVNSDIINSDGVVPSSDLSGSIGGPQASLYRKLFKGFSIGGQVALGKIKNESASTDFDFFSMHGAVKYGINIDGKFSPYLKAGVYGSTSLKDGTDSGSKNTDYSNFGTVGFDLALGDKLGLYAEYSLGKINENPEVDYGVISAGLSYDFGVGDRDKDGVNDKKDKCPDTPGLKEFDGCPDTDGDGLPDPEDDCPEEAGPEENKGCPDTDGDTVLDKDDACPEVAGLVELNGCPDADEDGVADGEDECPEQAGPAENNGCPWPDADNDGVADKDDACPEEAGTTENGCPELTDEIMSTINKVGSSILFPANSAKILGKKSLNAIAEIKTILDENPNGGLVIQGHASSDGNADYNQKLSLQRAESVRDELVEMGVDASRLEVVAMGSSTPLNGDESDRSANRRVEFYKK